METIVILYHIRPRELIAELTVVIETSVEFNPHTGGV